MVAAVQGPGILTRARRSDRELDALVSKIEHSDSEPQIIQTIQRSAEVGYSAGYLAGFTAAQSSIREAIGLPERD